MSHMNLVDDPGRPILDLDVPRYPGQPMQVCQFVKQLQAFEAAWLSGPAQQLVPPGEHLKVATATEANSITTLVCVSGRGAAPSVIPNHYGPVIPLPGVDVSRLSATLQAAPFGDLDGVYFVDDDGAIQVRAAPPGAAEGLD
ncbi:hypothetical protein [Kitasatospora sp. MAP5-34]|uniref:hypothetical protein n=1 Tax=Kitasatospora sp. MAP5-34 TaxID=3035102 RepID=UPI002475E889|nr:hypothetical protein [Kitasatospora sp. MAP5-34]MDH6580026.1 hypothetical protein [Kitasatospora sp. MAP5-34]